MADSTRSPAVAGMGRPFRDFDLTDSIGLIEETERLNFALILVVTDVMDGRRSVVNSRFVHDN